MTNSLGSRFNLGLYKKMEKIEQKINVHLYPSNLLFETRINKIVHAIDELNKFSEFWVIGMNNGNLPEIECISNKIKYFRVGRSANGGNLILKIKSFLTYYLAIVKILRHKKIACVNAHSLSVLPLAVFLKLQKNCKAIYDTHELETETPSLVGVRRMLAKATETIFIKYVDHIFCVSEPIADWYKNRYSLPMPSVVLNSPDARLLKKSNYLRKVLNLTNDCVIHVFFGILGPDRGIEELLDSFAIMNDPKSILVLIGYGSLEEVIRNSAGFNRTIYLLPAMPQEELFDAACSADVGLCLVKPVCKSFDYCMPNKLFEYMSAGLPVVVGPCSSLIKFVTENNVGVVAGEINPESIIDSIRRINAIEAEEMRARAYRVFVENSWQRQSEKLKSAYQNI